MEKTKKSKKTKKRAEPLTEEGFCALDPVTPATGRCKKGELCEFKHIPVKERGPTDPPIKEVHRHGLKTITYQPNCAAGVFVIGTVFYAECPSDFYVLPETDWTCLTEKPTPRYLDLTGTKRKDFRPNKTVLDELVKKVTATILDDLPGHSRSHYKKMELVGCRIDRDGIQEWHRGYVREDSKDDLVNVQLLDIGKFMTLPIERVAVLPRNCGLKYKQFTRRCSLFGVIPVGPIWRESTKEIFKEMVIDKRALIEIKRPANPEPEPDGNFWGTPYEVELTILENPEDRRNPARYLCSIFVAIQLNPFPYRPDILRMRGDIMTPVIQSLFYPFPNDLRPDGEAKQKEIDRIKMKFSVSDRRPKHSNMKIVQTISNPEDVLNETDGEFVKMISDHRLGQSSAE